MTTTTASRTEAAARSIEHILQEADIEAEVTCHEDSVEITSANAHPDQRALIDRTARDHQSARSHIQTDSWSHDNRRDDIPQATWVRHYPRYTRDFFDRVEAAMADLGPKTQLDEVQFFEALVKGNRPEFWTRELGGPQPYRCTMCAQPIEDVNDTQAPWNKPGQPMRHARC